MKRNAIAGNPAATAASLQFFTDGDLERIHLATLKVLKKVGFILKATRLLKS
ncbi:MAG: hypothetical protein AAGU27_00395 [Dehalobacterium sp.]